MAGFIIIDKDKEHYFPLKKEYIKDFTEIDGVKIPLQSLEEWRLYYHLMGRIDKVKLIDLNIGGLHMDHFESQIKELESRIAEVKKRFPYHSVQPYLIQELEELEDQLDELMKKRIDPTL